MTSVEVEPVSSCLAAVPRVIKVAFESPEARVDTYIWYVNYLTPNQDYRWPSTLGDRHYVVSAVVAPSHADFVVVMGAPTEECKDVPKRKKIFFQLDPTAPFPQDTDGYKVLVPLESHYRVAVPWVFAPYRQQLELDYPLKERGLVVIFGNKTATPQQQKRLELVRRLVEAGIELDIYSRDLTAADLPPGANLVGRLEQRDKSPALLPYRYCLAVEKLSLPNFITNHFLDAMLCYAMPLYWGAPNVGELYPTGSYHQLQPFDTADGMDRCVEDIRTRLAKPVTAEEVAAMSEGRRRILNHYSLWATLRQRLPEMVGQ